MKEKIKNILKLILPMRGYIYIIQGFRIYAKDYIILGHLRKPIHDLPEKGVRIGILKYVGYGMNCVQVGGGSGITSLYTLDKIGNDGLLTIYEGGYESTIIIKKNLSINNFTNYRIKHAIVGMEKNVYGGDLTQAELIDPINLPQCNYLELDCEGSEKSILENMKIRPDFIVVEIHPNLIDESVDWLYNWINQNSYAIDYYSGHDGNLITGEEFTKLYNHNLKTGEGRVESISGRAPMVIGLIKD